MKIKIPRYGNLTKEEVKYLKNLPKRKSSKQPEDVIIVDYGNPDYKDFVDNFFKQRIGKTVKIESASVFAFSNVSMHTDGASSNNCGGLIFMTNGRGTLTHFLDRKNYNKINYNYNYLFLGKYIFLNDKLPHSFSTDKTCHALIADVPRSYFK